MIALARAIFRHLPLSEDQRMRVRHLVFRYGGERFRHLPGYPLYLRHREWDQAPVPGSLADYRKAALRHHPLTGRAMVMISHRLGGGTGQHVDDMAARLSREGWRVYSLERHNRDHLRLIGPQGEAEPLFFRWPEELSALGDTLRGLGVEHLHLHHTVDLPEDFPARFADLVRAAGVAYDFTVHDYFSICPRFTLYDEAVRGYCGEPEDARKCIACVTRFGSPVGKDIDVVSWRMGYAALLAGARRVFVPDADVAIRLKRYFPAVMFTLHPHPEVQGMTALAAERQAGEALKIVTIGGIAPHKGSHVIFDCAKDALARGLPLEFHLIGYSDIDHRLKTLRNVSISGRFDAAELPQRIRDGGFHLAFLPSVWPETYNYVLSECWRHGLFTVGLDIGAIASRIKAAPELGAILPLEWYLRPDRINNALLALDIPALREEAVCRQWRNYPSASGDYYGL